MAFDTPDIMLVGLLKIELPGDTIRLCDGGFIYFAAEKYESSDTDFGSVESMEALTENIGDEAPAGRLTFLPASAASAATLSQPEYQGSRMRFWIGTVNASTGVIVDTELIADMELDTTKLVVGMGTRKLEMECIAIAERLFNINEGNVLSPRFHKYVWPGELGLDNATGVPLQIAWGVKGVPRGSSGSMASTSSTILNGQGGAS